STSPPPSSAASVVRTCACVLWPLCSFSSTALQRYCTASSAPGRGDRKATAHRQTIRYGLSLSFSCAQQYTERQRRGVSPTKLRWAVQAGSTWIRRIEHTGPERNGSADSASAEKEGEYGEVRRSER